MDVPCNPVRESVGLHLTLQFPYMRQSASASYPREPLPKALSGLLPMIKTILRGINRQSRTGRQHDGFFFGRGPGPGARPENRSEGPTRTAAAGFDEMGVSSLLSYSKPGG